MGVLTRLKRVCRPYRRIVFLAGTLYRENLVLVLDQLGFEVEIPMRGLSIGLQKAWLKKRLHAEDEVRLR